jgi:hypothetical protein
MEDERKSFPIQLDAKGRSMFRFANHCQKGYFPCGQNCATCTMDQKMSENMSQVFSNSFQNTRIPANPNHFYPPTLEKHGIYSKSENGDRS